MTYVNIKESPEKFGLRTVGEVEFSSGSYEFDTSIVWQDVDTGALYVADDSGCSCPEPFGNIDRDDLTKIDRLQDLIDYFDRRRTDSYYYDPIYAAASTADIDGQIGTLIYRCGDLLTGVDDA